MSSMAILVSLYIVSDHVGGNTEEFSIAITFVLFTYIIAYSMSMGPLFWVIY